MSIGQLHEKQYAEIAASEQHTAALDELREQLLATQTELKEAKLALSRAESAHIRRLKQDASWFEGQPQGRPNTDTQAAALLDEYKEQVLFILGCRCRSTARFLTEWVLLLPLVAVAVPLM